MSSKKNLLVNLQPSKVLEMTSKVKDYEKWFKKPQLIKIVKHKL